MDDYALSLSKATGHKIDTAVVEYMENGYSGLDTIRIVFALGTHSIWITIGNDSIKYFVDGTLIKQW